MPVCAYVCVLEEGEQESGGGGVRLLLVVRCFLRENAFFSLVKKI